MLVIVCLLMVLLSRHYRFSFNVLESQRSTGIGDIGSVKWSLCLCLLAVIATVYFALWKGVKSSGKVCSFLTFQYVQS